MSRNLLLESTESLKRGAYIKTFKILDKLDFSLRTFESLSLSLLRRYLHSIIKL